jgi:hypothetical protein
MLIKILSYTWLIVFLLLGIAMLEGTPLQMLKDKEFINKHIKPAVTLIDSFKKANSRLPTNAEFNELLYTSLSIYEEYNPYDSSEESLVTGYIRDQKNVPDEIKTQNVDWSNNYALAVWRGEWFEYYTSWDHKYIGNNYKWSSSISKFFYMAFIGGLPFIIPVIRKLFRKRFSNH